MAVTVSELYSEALLLSDEARIELAERLIEGSRLPDGLLEEHLEIVRTRIENLDAGRSTEIPADEAHERVLKAISSKA